MRDFNRSRLQEKLRDKAMENARHNLKNSVQNKERRSDEQNPSSAPHECESEEKSQELSLEMPKNAKRLEMPKPISQELCWEYGFCETFISENKGSLIEFRCTVCFFPARNLKLKC